MSIWSVVAPHDEMRARDVNKVARGEQAPRPTLELGSISQAPPPPPNLPKKVEEMRTAPADSGFPPPTRPATATLGTLSTTGRVVTISIRA
ncbi:uncharacterized protein LOC132252816 isoform X2 [Vitis vinifera]|uniref:uncharacterized protein LOC132252816 isoform X2 n=1 Tax=Vitis vinifera TaxID=29760 RepID=UPI002882F704|nr:uncharacterized protein LOC132252816 isoform X2 [Vitis vinifera]